MTKIIRKDFLFAFPLIGIIISLSTCQYPDKPHDVILNDSYQLEVTAYMNKTSELNADAEVQFQNKFRNRYLLVFQSQKQEPFKDFVDQRVQQLLDKVQDSVISKSTAKKVNGIQAHERVINAKVGEERIYYKLMFYEGKKHFYQLVVWTRDDKLAPFKQDMEKIATSFQRKE
jgi:hypothetical protein